jgi:hypothetical protein
VAILLLTLAATSLAGAPASAQQDAGTDAERRDASTVVIEGLSDEDPANLRAPAWERAAEPEPIERDFAWVREMVARTGPLVRGLQRPAQLVWDVRPYFRTAVRYQVAAIAALEAGDLVVAARLTMWAREIVRKGLAEEHVTLGSEFEDTNAERAYAAQASAEDAVPYLMRAYEEWDDDRASPFRSPHLFEWRLPAGE